jgi:hypothetical protein
MINKNENLEKFIRELVLEINMETTSENYLARMVHLDSRIKQAAVWLAKKSAEEVPHA